MKDHSALPREPGGRTPDAEPWLAPRLAEAWAATLEDDTPPMASSEARIRHSWAGMCARAVGYHVTKTPVSEPLTVADHWRFGTGKVIHERWQAVVAEAFPEAEVEKKVVIDEIPSAGHIDLFLPSKSVHAAPGGDFDSPSTAVELKTINGFGFKSSIGARGNAEGPRTSATVQGALNAHAAEADELKIVYLSLENLSPRELAKIGVHEWQRFAAEWTIPQDEWRETAEVEIRRFKKILEVVDAGDLPPRAIPGDLPKGARITDPSKGTWVVASAEGITASGSTWQCAYCPFTSQCIKDGAS